MNEWHKETQKLMSIDNRSPMTEQIKRQLTRRQPTCNVISLSGHARPQRTYFCSQWRCAPYLHCVTRLQMAYTAQQSVKGRLSQIILSNTKIF